MSHFNVPNLALNSSTLSKFSLLALYPPERPIAYWITGKKQANQKVNEDDKAFNSRYLLFDFACLESSDGADDPNLYDKWMMLRELMSALTIDFTTLTIHGKLDREAIQDCAQFLQLAVGRKRDRNANMWGILLYFMLVINLMAQVRWTVEVPYSGLHASLLGSHLRA